MASLTESVAEFAEQARRPVTTSEVADKFKVTQQCAMRAMQRVAARGGEMVELSKGRKALRFSGGLNRPVRNLAQRIVATTPEGRLFEFTSLHDARRNGYTPTCIVRAIGDGNTYAGLLWRYAEDEQWTPDEVRLLLDGGVPKGKSECGVAKMRALCGITTGEDATEAIQRAVMTNRMTIDEAAAHYNVTSAHVCAIMGWA